MSDTTSTKRMLVVGATGPLGRLVAEQAVAAGAEVRALVRGEPLDIAGVTSVRGNVLDVDSLAEAADGVDAVVSCLGTGVERQRVTLLSEGTANLIEAMARRGVQRLVCVTGMGAGDSRGHGGFVYDRIVLPRVLNEVYADKDRQESVVQASALDWVLVRPARLTNRPARGSVRQLPSPLGDGVRLRAVTRADVAEVLVREALDGRHHRGVLNLSS